jgi:hypothetical protein
MSQFELVDAGTCIVRLDDVSLDPETVWRPLDDSRVAEIEQNIMEGNWLASPIEFPVLIGNANGVCFDAKACQLWAGVPMHKTTHMWLTFCIAGRSNRS